jgi:cytochrome b561
MSYEEKGVWVYILAIAATATIYAFIIVGKLANQSVAEVDFGSTLLWSIGISIALNIVLRILVEIFTPSDSYKVDARDKAISRRGGYVNGVIIAIGMAGPLLLTIADVDNFWVANAIYAVFILAAIASSVVQVVTYRRGF